MSLNTSEDKTTVAIRKRAVATAGDGGFDGSKGYHEPEDQPKPQLQTDSKPFQQPTLANILTSSNIIVMVHHGIS